jgi:hypothetical protein
MGYWGDLVNDVRTNFDPNSKDYQVLKALLLNNIIHPDGFSDHVEE